MKSLRTIKYLIIFLLILANIFVWKYVFDLDGNLKLVFFDIGQGDSIFIETPQGHQILIDGGPSGKGVLEKLSKVIPFWDNSLDMIILTHPDYDHLAGLNYVLDRYNVDNILWTGVLRETKTFSNWLEKIKDYNVIIAKKGQTIKAGKVMFYVLYPFESLEGELFENNSNDSSIVAKLLFGNNSFLFTGDITKKVEKQLVNEDIDSDVLKIAHHGSKNSSSMEFLEKVSPFLSVISCGLNNSYGHPHADVLQRLNDFGIIILRTDEKGDIKIVSNGNSFIYED